MSSKTIYAAFDFAASVITGVATALVSFNHILASLNPESSMSEIKYAVSGLAAYCIGWGAMRVVNAAGKYLRSDGPTL